MNGLALSCPVAICIGIALYPAPLIAQDASAAMPDTMLFLIQQRCSTPGALPGDLHCGHMRPISPGEDPLYRLSNGLEGAGRIDMINVPVWRNGKWRVVSPDGHVDASNATDRGGVSIEGAGPLYLSVLGSWSPVAFSSFANSSCETMPDRSERFLDSWVLGPTHNTRALAGHGVTHSGNLMQKEGRASGQACPARYRAAAFSWVREDYVYRSGRRFPSLISVHYSAANAQGQPGPAQQRERLYLAWGLGLARWEKWSREDWQSTRTGETALAQARRVFESGRCNEPAEDREQGDGVRYSPVSSADSYAETIRESTDAPPYRWYLTQCQDYTSLRAGPAQDLMRLSQKASPAFWQ